MALRRFSIELRLVRFAALALCAATVGLAHAGQSSSYAGQAGRGESEFHMLFEQGFQLHQQSRFAEAIPVLEKARRLEPGDYFANLLLGIDLLRSGKAAEALPRLRLAARARPDEEFPEDYLGEAEAGLGEHALAAEAYQQALQRGHNSEQALEAWAGFGLERFRQIGEELRASQEGLAVARRLQDAAGKPVPAEKCVPGIPMLERKLALKPVQRNRAVSKRPNVDGEAAYQLSLCYAVAAGKAADLLQSPAQSGAVDMTAVYRLRGDVLLRLKGDGAAAEAEYNRAVALRQGDPALLERLAEAQLASGKTEEAGQSAKAALAIDPHRRAALHTVAALAMNNREYEQALPVLRQLSVEAPGDPAVSVELGRALAQTGESAQAFELLGPALAAGYPDEKGATHALLAKVLRKLGREADAVKADAEARRLSDNYQARTDAHESRDAH